MSLKFALDLPTNSNDSDIAFRLKLPKNDLALRSVRVVDGIPELLFDASQKVPTIQEEDVAVAFRLAQEKTRPEFFYRQFSPTHPLFLSRKFMQYSPTWLRWTGVGELLAEADWTMKCLNVGARSNEDKTSFKSWSHSSNLDGLATSLDFPSERSSGSIIMSCEYAKVEKNDDEIWFPEEPKMRIKSDCSPLYSKYITECYPSIAYHDEPKFLKVQELIKLVLAVEWLYNEKGVRVNQEWVRKHTSQPTDDSCFKLEASKKPANDMIPVPDKLTVRPTSDVMVKKWEVEMYKKSKVERRYGYYDFGGAEVVMFKEDGTECPPQKCLKFFWENSSIIGNESIKTGKGWLYLPIPNAEATENLAQIRDHFLDLLSQNDRSMITYPIPALVEFTTEDSIDGNILELKCTHKFKPCPSLVLPPMKKITIIKGTLDSYDKFFASEDPNEPIPEIPGICEAVVPNVNSWSELISELTVPAPQVWLLPFTGVGVTTAAGGVTTANFKVVQEPSVSKVAETQWNDDYVYQKNISKQNRDLLAVRPTRILERVILDLINPLSEVFGMVLEQFSKTWKKQERCPQVHSLFKIVNIKLEKKWNEYRKLLGNQVPVEQYFHGTALKCNITATGSVCDRVDCAICGISSYGPDSRCIGSNCGLRFGKGFYLALNSSKSDNYTRENENGYRALLLCKILPGNICPFNTDATSTSRLPDCDTLYVEGDTKFNKDPEIVVKKTQAVLPCYIIVYKKG